MNAHDAELKTAPPRAAQNLSHAETLARGCDAGSFESGTTRTIDNSLRLAITPCDLEPESARRHVRAVLDHHTIQSVILEASALGSPTRAIAQRLTRFLAALGATGRGLQLQNLHPDLHAALEALGGVSIDSSPRGERSRSAVLVSDQPPCDSSRSANEVDLSSA